LTSDDLLYRMNLRIWDDPLKYIEFIKAIKLLDPTFTDVQIKALAKSLKSHDDKIDITNMIRNLCGEEFETVDYRNRIFKKIYENIYSKGKGAALKEIFTKLDTRFDGTLEPFELKQALIKVGGSAAGNEQSIDRFVRFLEKN
jgi:hypothetical protein